MTSYIISSSNKEKRDAYAFSFAQEKKIDQFDITTLRLEREEKNKKVATKQSIGIEEIKQLQQKIYLKPIRSPEKAIIIEDAELLTPEAQNAMLKILEEPPEQTLILLVTDSTESLLPTILSRCKLITLEEEKKEVIPVDLAEITEFYTSLTHFSIKNALEYAEKIGKSKAEAVSWLEKAIRIIRENYLVTNSDAKTALIVIKHLQETHTLIKTTNVNVRMSLENTFLSLC